MSHVPILVDLMDNNANVAFSAWPERLYVLRDNKIVYKGGVGPFCYDIDELGTWMANNIQ